MEYLSRGFKSVLGNQQGGSQPSPHETVRICLNFVIYDVWQFQTFILTINFDPGWKIMWPRSLFYAAGRQTGCCSGAQVSLKGKFLMKIKRPHQSILVEKLDLNRKNARSLHECSMSYRSGMGKRSLKPSRALGKEIVVQ